MASHESSDVRFAAYGAALVDVIGHADRATPLRDYWTGLLMPAARKSVEPMAAVTAPARVAAQHQSLLHFVGQAVLGVWRRNVVGTRFVGRLRRMPGALTVVPGHLSPGGANA